MDWVYVLNVIGVFVFAISGTLTAIDNGFDVVGASIIAFITALGGGTLRDILIGKTPVGWMLDANYLWIILGALLVSYLFKEYIQRLRKSMFIFDTIGIGVFTILGLQTTLEVGLNPAVAILMGVVSAVFGGVIRDVLSNIVPLIFRSEIYASTCVAGGLVYLLLEMLHVPFTLNMLFSMAVIFVIRYFAVTRKWILKF
ncbi:MAG: trimeric intracellular cation channel family protein [Bacteroidia bacterium]|jgi:uncharacterized membrane protein YeiH|tara:strand:+ start:8775 stop:9371 length:597 start_codon:yes stop_codon:yes gene_type:complete